MNMLSQLRAEIVANGSTELTAEKYDQLQTEWITRCGLEHQQAKIDELEARIRKQAVAALATMADHGLEIEELENQLDIAKRLIK